MMSSTSVVRVYSYTNYRTFLLAKTNELRETGMSFRTIAAQCDLQSPNYLQLVIQGRRNLTTKTARKIGAGMGLGLDETEYFAKLVNFEHESSGDQKIALLEDLKKHVQGLLASPDATGSLNSHWLHSVLFEMAGNKTVPLTIDHMLKRLGGLATRAEITSSLEFLQAHGFLKPTDQPGVFERHAVNHEASDDVRRIESQQNHLRYLEMAKRRVNDASEDGTFQGFTIAITPAKMPVLHERIRTFIDTLSHDLAGENQTPDEVVRVQVAAFRVTG